MKKLLLGVAIGITSGLALMLYIDNRGEVKTTPAQAELTLTLSGAASYADTEWTSLCISNKPIDGNGDFVAGGRYTGVFESCAWDKTQDRKGDCYSVTVTPANLTSEAQVIVNQMNGFWLAAYPEYAKP